MKKLYSRGARLKRAANQTRRRHEQTIKSAWEYALETLNGQTIQIEATSLNANSKFTANGSDVTRRKITDALNAVLIRTRPQLKFVQTITEENLVVTRTEGNTSRFDRPITTFGSFDAYVSRDMEFLARPGHSFPPYGGSIPPYARVSLMVVAAT